MNLSIVIVNWNTRELLLNCLRSIENHTTRTTYEIIVVDNGSTDGSVDEVNRQFPTVKVLSTGENLGFAKANNFGINIATGKYVCLINSDIELRDGCLDDMFLYIEDHLEIGVLGPAIFNGDLTPQLSYSDLPSLRNSLTHALFLDRLFPRVKSFRSRFPNLDQSQATKRVAVLSGCFLMVRRTALDEVGPLDERFFIYKEDVDWCKRFSDAGWHVVFYPRAQAIHYGGASSAAAPIRFVIEMERANQQYWSKHHSWPARTLFVAICFTHYALRLSIWSLTYLFNSGMRSNARHRIRACAFCLCWMIGGVRRSAHHV